MVKLSNHPVHLVTKNGKKKSPSALIPLCDLGGNMSIVGTKIDESHFCNCFEDKVLNDQLCYEVDLKRFSNRDNVKTELKLGFGFVLSYNEDMQVFLDEDIDRSP